VVAPRALGTQPGRRSGDGVLALEASEDDLTDHVGVELVGQASASVLADEARCELLCPGEQWVRCDLDGLGLDPRSPGLR
jgi:hypothetical protein